MVIQQQKSWNVLLVGDSCEDVYHYGICERMSPEAPIPVFKEDHQRLKQGMSSNVRLNLESFAINVEHWHNREKIRKHRFIEQSYNQQLFRFDEGENSVVRPLEPVVSKAYDAIVISDYNKGFITPESYQKLRAQVGSDIPIFVDSKKADLSIFEDCILKINESEASRAHIKKTQNVVVTLGGLGARWAEQIFKTEKVDVYDVCGAGDVFLSALVYGYLRYRDMPEAIVLANKCASLSVTKMGTYVLTKEDINDLCI